MFVDASIAIQVRRRRVRQHLRQACHQIECIGRRCAVDELAQPIAVAVALANKSPVSRKKTGLFGYYFFF